MTDLIKPGRQTGNAQSDIGELFNQAYKVFVVLQQSADGADGSIDGMRSRIAALETGLKATNAILAAIAGITPLDMAITNPVNSAQGAVLQAAINAIIANAKASGS
jgi:hypothetical protein